MGVLPVFKINICARYMYFDSYQYVFVNHSSDTNLTGSVIMGHKVPSK